MGYGEMLSPECIEPVLWSALVAIEGQASEMCKVDTGNLRNSITIATNRRSKREGPPPPGAKSAEISLPSEDYVGVVGTAVEYAHAVEYGLPEKPGYPSQPYMRPAFDWFRRRVGIITAGELKSQMAAYRVRHPHMIKKALGP